MTRAEPSSKLYFALEAQPRDLTQGVVGCVQDVFGLMLILEVSVRQSYGW